LTSKKEKKEHDDKLEQGITMVYEHIPDSTQAPDRSAEEKIKISLQKIEGYRKEIEEIKEKLNPMTPPKV
jgi:hypothetical protein